ncbi:phage Gp37/Gp68 family protein [Mycolicibacterium canariasense]|uniref:phage Gp37/Gp68 family protein n=1 Tax=Mycolicibacterium canariasense TaxID=228230 RepID=UPI000A2297D0|nr:phage Gp37/Gp68 family protein [Mycolicibacterium canariasense]ORV13539.1 hypothetical protein AWB94_04775 [Mycolicibacterium canariasense]
MADTAIEWATKVWNPTTGCDRVSPGCDHCYALTMAKRLKGMGHPKYQRDGDPRTSGPGFGAAHHPAVLSDPFKWRKPQRVFVNSMSDLFHKAIPDEFIAGVWSVMKRNPDHTFMVLTKRHDRMRSLVSSPEFREMVFTLGGVGCGQAGGHLEHFRQWPVPNVWLGVSTENQRWADIRIPALLDTPAAVRFISAEPLLYQVLLRQAWLHPIMKNPTPENNALGRRIAKERGVGLIDWVIAGGESGRGARPMNPRWARSLRDQCVAAGVPFFLKQWGEWGPAPWKIDRDPDEFTLDYKARAEALGASHAFTGGLYTDDHGDWVENFMELSHKPWSVERAPEAPSLAEGMKRWGKKAAGRELDGRTWDQFPEPLTV